MRRAAAAVALAAVAATLPVGPGGLVRPARGEATRPNVLVIVTDDQRIDTFGVMPRTRRWFWSGGAQFPNTFATTPLCCPSRTSIMTGQYAHNHGVENNSLGGKLDQRATVQRYLQEEGYRTAMLGKVLNGWHGSPQFLERWATFEEPSKYYGVAVNVSGQVRKVKRYSTDYLASRAVGFLRAWEADDQEPWYMYLAPFAPHDPYDPAKRDRHAKVGRWGGNPSVRERDRSDKPDWVRTKRRQTSLKEGREIRRDQLRTLMAVDDMVEKVFRELGALGEDEGTLAVYISDNGKHWGEHGLGGKQDPYTHSIRIPLFLRWPGHVPAGAVDPRLALNADVGATVLDVAGVHPDPEYPVDGRSLVEPSTRDHVFTENKFGGKGIPSWASVRTATYQYTEYYDESLEAVTFREYYDLVADPWQLTNILADGDPANDPPPEELTLLSLQISGDRRCEGTSGPGACP